VLVRRRSFGTEVALLGAGALGQRWGEVRALRRDARRGGQTESRRDDPAVRAHDAS